MTEPTPEVYEAAARTLWFACGQNPAAFDDPDRALHRDAYRHTAGRVVDAIWPAGVAAGRAQAAADIREEHERIRPATMRYCGGGLVGMATDNAYNNAAKIAGGDPR